MPYSILTTCNKPQLYLSQYTDILYTDSTCTEPRLLKNLVLRWHERGLFGEQEKETTKNSDLNKRNCTLSKSYYGTCGHSWFLTILVPHQVRLHSTSHAVNFFKIEIIWKKQFFPSRINLSAQNDSIHRKNMLIPYENPLYHWTILPSGR